VILHHEASRTSLSLYAVDVLLRHDVPSRHVLFHALRVAGGFARGQRRTGFGDAALEAVFVEFLMRASGLACVCFRRWKLGEREKAGIDDTSTSCLAFATAASCATCCLMAWVWLAPVGADEPPRKDMIVYADVMYELQLIMRICSMSV
jgi:hypothetical protein